MRQRHMLDNGQTQANAIRSTFALRGATIEPLEDTSLVFLGNAHALVDDSDYRLLSILGLDR